MSCKSNYPNFSIKDLKALGKLIGNYPFNHKKWRNQIIFYEKSWKYYLCNIFLPIFNKNDKKEITVIIWESCPGGMVFPHPNYAFINLDEPVIWPRDKFLIDAAKIASGSGLNWADIKPYFNCDEPTKRDVLNWISKKGYLIMDLLPTHGFEMKNIRKKITTSSSKTLINEGMNVIRNHWRVKNEYVIKKLKIKSEQIEEIIDYYFIRKYYNFPKHTPTAKRGNFL